MYVNWLDLLLGGTFLISLIGAARNGVTREVIRLIALFFGIVGAMWGYQRLAVHYEPYLGASPATSFAAFVSIIVGCLIVGAALAWAFDKIWGFAGLRWFDRLLGAGFGMVRGLAMAAAMVLGVVAFAPVAGAEATVAESRLAPWVLFGARACVAVAPAVLRDAYSAGFERVREQWSAPRAPRGRAIEEAAPRGASAAKASPVHR